jgi:thymidylate kinase
MDYPLHYRNMSRGKFIVFEGINGSGKGTCAQYISQYLQQTGLKLFDTTHFEKEHFAFPELTDFEHFDFIYSAEPTYAWVGAALRKEAFYDNGRDYSPQTMLNAYALDRYFHYRRVIVPALEHGLHVIQERSFGTSLAFQPTGKNGVSFSDIVNHPDHEFVMKNLPDMIILIDIDPVKVMSFLDARQKKDKDVFEQLDQERLHRENYNAESYKKFFTDRGVQFKVVENTGTLEQLKEQCLKLVLPILSDVRL